MNFYMFGLQRSGTNFAFLMLDMNFENMHQVNLLEQPNDSPIWKHLIQPKPDWTPEYPIITISKNPYMWAESILYRNAMDFYQSHTYQRYNPDFPMVKKIPNEQGIIEPGWGTRWDRLIPENMPKAYNRHIERWVIDNDWDTYHIRYEDLLIERRRIRILEEIQSKYNLVWKEENKYGVPGAGEVINSDDYTSDMSQYYIDQIPKKLHVTHIKHINDHVTDRVMQYLGYERP